MNEKPEKQWKRKRKKPPDNEIVPCKMYMPVFTAHGYPDVCIRLDVGMWAKAW
jgi:hypothetical protein